MNKIIEGIVIDNKHALNGTLFVQVASQSYNKFFRKILKSTKIYTVHHEEKTMIEKGSKVMIISCRPISKNKSHKVYKGEVKC